MLNVNTCEARNCFPRLLITRNMSLNSLACLGRSRLLFLTLRLFLEQLRQQTRHIIPRAGWRGIFFIALCTHLPENSFAVAKMERRPLFSTRTQFLTRKKHYYSTLLVRYFCTRRISPPNAKPCLSKISI